MNQTPNSIDAEKISGKKKSDPTQTWHGLVVKATVDDVYYEGLIFPKNNSGEKVKF